jgi:signal transduction histidine kinase
MLTYVGANIYLKNIGVNQVVSDPLADSLIHIIGGAILEKNLPGLPQGIALGNNDDDARIVFAKARLEQGLNLPPGSLRGYGWNGILESATRDRDRRMERQVALSVWKEDVLGRDRDRYNKTLFDNLRMSFNQGIGFGGLVTLASLIADTSKIVDGNYLVGTDLMDLLIENARMAESAMRRFEEIDQLIRGEIDLREASIAEVHTLVCRVADSLHSLLDIKSQSVVVSEPPRQSGIVRISERLLTDAVRELLINAMKFSKPSSQIFVLFRRTASHLHCSFVNTPGENQFGSRGVPEEHQRLIFEPFYRIVRTVDERFGTLDYGLGLSVVEKIIQGHQGRIRAGNIHDFFSKGAEGESAANFELQLPLMDT